jgi:hypothetical protein
VDNEIVGVDLPRNFNHCLVISFAPTLSILVADPRPKCARRSFCER